MKKIFLLFLIVSSVKISFSQSWVYIGALPTPDAVNSIAVVDANTIWVCGDATLCYRSTNGGFNWTAAYTGLPNGNLYGISATDANNCWVGTGTGSIYRTTNGGANWTLQVAVANSFIDGIKMFDNNYGVYYADPTAQTGQPYQLRRTVNGGVNWLLSPTAPTSSTEFGVINAWDWTDTLHFWLGSANTTPNASSARIYRTSTGFFGTWAFTSVTGTGDANGLYYQAIAFINATSGMAGNNASKIVKTTDGGVTWQTATNPPGLTAYNCITMNGLKDNSGTIRVVINETAGYKVFKTTNLGTSWTQEPIPSQGTTSGLQHMQFLNASLGFAGGGAGTFFRYGPPLAIDPNNNNVPSTYSLQQNYPNPFNPSTVIKYSVPVSGNVSIKIYNSIGMEVKTVVNKYHGTGNYEENLNLEGFASGLYFYTMQAGDFKETKRMMLVK